MGQRMPVLTGACPKKREFPSGSVEDGRHRDHPSRLTGSPRRPVGRGVQYWDVAMARSSGSGAGSRCRFSGGGVPAGRLDPAAPGARGSGAAPNTTDVSEMAGGVGPRGPTAPQSVS